MDAQRFDDLTRSFARRVTRRRVLRGMGGGLAAVLAGHSASAAPRCKRIDQVCKTTADCCPEQNGTYCAGTKKTTCQPCAGIICKGGCTICPAEEIADPTRNCACVCRPGLTRCNGVCVDLQSDPTNCGQCGVGCDDGEVCTADACLAGQCVSTAIANCCHTNLNCDDNDPCTDNTCVANQCQSVPVNCPGADVCNGAACSPNIGCYIYPICTDGNDCTEDVCDPDTGACTFVPLTGTSCTVIESGNPGTCDNGACVPIVCFSGMDFCEHILCSPGDNCVCASLVLHHEEPICARFDGVDCFPCHDDAECESHLGPGAGCVLAECCSGGTTCVVPC